MEYSPASLLFSFVLLVLTAALVLLANRKYRRGPDKQPPQPPGWPVIGNILDLGTAPHQQLYEMRAKYGPVMWLKLGSLNTMVIQTANAAGEFFKNHDLVFADRKCPGALTAHNYNQGSLAVANYGADWRGLRRLCTAELLVGWRINETTNVRQKCLDDMIKFMKEDMVAGRAEKGVNLSHLMYVMVFNMVGNLVLSKDLLDPNSKEGLEFYDAMEMFMMWAGKPNLADFFPWLKRLDPQRIKANMVKDLGRAMKIVQGFVRKRIEERNSAGERETKDFLDAVLDFEGDGKDILSKISPENVNIIILEMFFAGTETTTSSIEWAMVELLRHPEEMKKAKDELIRIIGTERKADESDIANLPFLQCVVKETLRLHPPLPLLLPRNAREDVDYMGYHVPEGTQVMVNAWAIGRDPEAWEDPLAFKPERFLDVPNIDYKGRNFELIPFGSGRRMCVGLALGDRVVHLTLATLLHCFDWELSDGLLPETVDMRERTGITLRKLVPLKAVPKNR